MNLDRTRMSFTLSHTGIFALILLLLGVVAVAGFSRELVAQQDELLIQEARNQTYNLLNDEHREVLSEGSDEFGWIALDPNGRVTDRDASARSLGLPKPGLAREALREESPVSATIHGSQGSVRAVSMPMYESGEVVGVIQYARSLQGVQEEVNGLVTVLIPLGLGALGLATIGGLYMAGRAVRPVREAFDRQRAFIADASHELKTPLTLIRADTEMLQRGLTAPNDRELADDVLAESDRMTNILSDLLLMARLDADKLAVQRKVFDLRAVISEVVDRFAARAASEDISIRAHVPGELLIRGDPGRTEQVLAVLLDNALTHTPSQGDVTVTGSSGGAFVEAVVKDAGPGIPPEHLPHIFKRFYRTDTARSRAIGGTGLGLSIAQGLARAQGGDLSAENGKDGGGVFRLKLPAG